MVNFEAFANKFDGSIKIKICAVFHRKDYVKKERDTSMKRDKDYSFLVQEYRTVSKFTLYGGST